MEPKKDHMSPGNGEQQGRGVILLKEDESLFVFWLPTETNTQGMNWLEIH